MPQNTIHLYAQVKDDLQDLLLAHYHAYAKSKFIKNSYNSIASLINKKPSMSKAELLNKYDYILLELKELNPKDKLFVDNLLEIVLQIGIFIKNIRKTFNVRLQSFNQHLDILSKVLVNMPVSELQTFHDAYEERSNYSQMFGASGRQNYGRINTLNELISAISQIIVSKQKLNLRVDASAFVLAFQDIALCLPNTASEQIEEIIIENKATTENTAEKVEEIIIENKESPENTIKEKISQEKFRFNCQQYVIDKMEHFQTILAKQKPSTQSIPSLQALSMGNLLMNMNHVGTAAYFQNLAQEKNAPLNLTSLDRKVILAQEIVHKAEQRIRIK